MANPNEGAAHKTPAYAWPCLFASLFIAVTLVWAWQWMPGVTAGTGTKWFLINNPDIASMVGFNMGELKAAGDQALGQWFGQNLGRAIGTVMGQTMGLVPIGAIIMAFPTTFLVQKVGPKWASVIGVCIALVATAICAVCCTTSWMGYMVGRFIFGLALACTIVAGPTCVSIWFPGATRGRAMAIWSTWAPIGIFTVNMWGGNVLDLAGGNIATLQWIWFGCMLVAGLVFFFVFREPRGDEVSEVSPERKRLRDVLQFFKSRQLWSLIILFAIFNYMNYAFSQYLKTWLAMDVASGGMGWEAGPAGLVGGLLCACGILGPIGGWIMDKLSRDKKWIAPLLGIISLTICMVLSFRANTPIFALYALFFCIGNMFLNGCCRPMVPTYVFKGGATAVAFGLSFLTCGQYLGQIPTSYAFSAGTAMGMSYSDIMMYFFVPVGIVGIIFGFLMKPSKPKGEIAEGGAPAQGGGKPE
ncbi:MAG: MFS transporter [Eggerthellaceae bacterium]|nr:MFS transporter [Eggerthellaceae bacterium]